MLVSKLWIRRFMLHIKSDFCVLQVTMYEKLHSLYLVFFPDFPFRFVSVVSSVSSFTRSSLNKIYWNSVCVIETLINAFLCDTWSKLQIWFTFSRRYVCAILEMALVQFTKCFKKLFSNFALLLSYAIYSLFIFGRMWGCKVEMRINWTYFMDLSGVDWKFMCVALWSFSSLKNFEVVSFILDCGRRKNSFGRANWDGGDVM